MIEGFRLSPQQHRLWSLQQENGAYGVQFAILLEGPLNAEVVRAALENAVRRHTILRTTFHRLPGMAVPIQVISDSGNFTWTERNLSDLSAEEQEARIAELIRPEEDSRDFERGPMMQAALLRLSEERHTLIVSLPAIGADSRTAMNLYHELARSFAHAAQDDEATEEPAQYIQFAEWQNGLIEEDIEEGGHRSNRFTEIDSLSALKIPFELRLAVEIPFRPQRFAFDMNGGVLSGLEEVANRHRTSVSTVLLACWQTLLWRLMGDAAAVVGYMTDGRKYEDLRSAFGLFAKYIPIRSRIEEHLWFDGLLERVIEAEREAFAWEEYFTWKAASEPPGSSPDTPFFPIVFDFEERPASYRADGVTLSFQSQYSCIDRFKIRLSCIRAGDSLSFELDYDPCYIEPASVTTLARYFETFLTNALEQPETCLSELQILADIDKHYVLDESRAEARSYPEDKCIHRLFEEQVERGPDCIAVVFEDQQLTYSELNRNANRLAHYLIGKGIRPGFTVGLCLERSLEIITGLLGILKAGAAYLPLDPELPKARIEYQLADAQCPVLITHDSLLNGLPHLVSETIILNGDWSQFDDAQESNPTLNLDSHTPAYMIYTSGSTGQPKGVVIGHQNLVNYVSSVCNRFQLAEEAAGYRLSFATVSTIAADLGKTAIYPSLVTGGCLHVISYSVATDGNRFTRYFSEHHVDLLKIVPSHLSALMDGDAKPLPRRFLILGGEALSYQFASHLSEICGDCKVINHYGPTETTIGTLTCDFSEHHRLHHRMGLSVPIGRPLSNTEAHILDRNLNQVPLGVAGELYIGGDGVAQYYVNKPEQTAERFIPNLYSSGTRLYRTGDLARRLPDGSIEFIGRVDNQVKINGYRIELGEIETALSGHPGIREAVVTAYADESDHKRLVAYIVPAQSAAPGSSELQAFLRQRLPPYMVPAAYVVLKALPITPNGKLDRQRLPAPGSRVDESAFQAPRTAAEHALLEIWREVLRVDQIGINDNFFELGGDSILSLQIVARATRANLQITHKQLFEHPTIAELAAVAGEDEPVKAQQSAITGDVPLIPIQQWFFDRNLDAPHHWNLGIMLEVQPPCDAELMRQAVRHLVVHHDALRLRFVRGESGWRQINAAFAGEECFTRIDLSTVAEDQQAQAIEHRAAQLQESLNLSEGPLLRVALFDLGPDKPGRVLIVVHHLVVDGVSWRILMADLQTAYEQLSKGEAVKLPAKTTSFKQWAELLSEYARSQTLEQELPFWIAMTQAENAGLRPDYPDGVALNLEESALRIVESLSLEETRALLQDVPGAYHTQINDVLLTALVRAFAAATGQRRLLIDLEGHGREPIFDGVDLSRTVGWFTTHFPVLLDLAWSSGVGEALKILKEQLRCVPHHGIGYGLLRYLSQDPETLERISAVPQAAISFNYLGQFDQVYSDSSQFKPALESQGRERSATAGRSHLLRVNAGVIDGCLQVNWEYSHRVFEPATIERLAQSFTEALQSIIAHCKSPNAGGYTISDFSAAELSQNELDVVLAAAGQTGEKCGTWSADNIEDLYRLSPLQEGLLYHSLATPGSDVYLRQLSFAIRGDLNVDAFERAWQQVVDRHGVLRTSFLWQGLERPLQVVYRQVTVRIEQLDWRGLPEGEEEDRLEEFSRAEKARGFELSQPPPMRLALIRTAEDSFHFVWSYHHLAMDAWSRSLLYREVMALYEAERKGREAQLEPARPYGDYIAWIRSQDHSKAETFWRKALAGFTRPTRLDGNPMRENKPEGHDSLAAEEVRISVAATSRIRKLTRRQNLTLNTLLQGAWALILSCYSGEDDVAFGTVVSGRPADLKGVESIVGAFINTLVLRVQLVASAPLISWLKGIQLLQVEMSQYEFSPLVEVQRWSDVPRGTPLFESILNFANQPPYASGDASDKTLEVAGVRFNEGTTYPLVVQVAPGPELTLRITYNKRRFEAHFIKELLGHMAELLWSFAEDSECALRDLMLSADVRKERAGAGIEPRTGDGPEARLYGTGDQTRRLLDGGIENGDRIGDRPELRSGVGEIESEPSLSGHNSLFVGARNPIEEVLMGVWVELFGVERISVYDQFLDLGGHSLLAIRVVSRVREAFDVNIALQSIFELQTIAGLAQAIEKALKEGQGAELSPIRAANRDGDLLLSFAQQRLWFIHQLDPLTPSYNLPAAVSFKGRLNIPALEQTLSEIARRHEILRTILIDVDGQPLQRILASRTISLPQVDLRSLPAPEREARVSQLATAEARRPFDLATGPLLRTTLLELGELEHALLFTLHHVVSDGWSTEILIKEVQVLYDHFSAGEASRLADLRIQYADYACWQREALQGDPLDAHLRYWEEQLADVQPVLKLSIARPRPLIQTSRGATRSLPIPASLSEQIKSLSKREGVTLFMTLLAAFKTLLLRYSGQEDIVVGSPTANRNRREIEELIGFFVNVFPLRTDLSGNPSFRELLGRVRKITLGAHAHQDAPFEKIVSHLQTERAEDHAPLFQNVFTLQNQNTAKQEFELPGLSLSYIPVSKETTHLDLHLDVTETTDGLVAGVRYRTDMFDADSIEQFLHRYVHLLREVASQPDWRLLDVPLDPGTKEISIRPSIVESTYQHQQFSF